MVDKLTKSADMFSETVSDLEFKKHLFAFPLLESIFRSAKTKRVTSPAVKWFHGAHNEVQHLHQFNTHGLLDLLKHMELVLLQSIKSEYARPPNGPTVLSCSGIVEMLADANMFTDDWKYFKQWWNDKIELNDLEIFAWTKSTTPFRPMKYPDKIKRKFEKKYKAGYDILAIDFSDCEILLPTWEESLIIKGGNLHHCEGIALIINNPDIHLVYSGN